MQADAHTYTHTYIHTHTHTRVFAGVYGTNALVNQYAAQLVATIKANQKVCTCGLALSIFEFEVGS